MILTRLFQREAPQKLPGDRPDLGAYPGYQLLALLQLLATCLAGKKADCPHGLRLHHKSHLLWQESRGEAGPLPPPWLHMAPLDRLIPQSMTLILACRD